MKVNEESKRLTDEAQTTPQMDEAQDIQAMSGSLMDDNMPLHEVEGELVEQNEVVGVTQTYIDNSQKLIELYGKTNGVPSKVMAELCVLTISSAVALTKLALFLVWYTRSYLSYECKTMKDFILRHTNITYDAGIKQLEAAKICAELFGLNRMGDFSDNALRTIARLPVEVRSKVVDEICNEYNVDRATISKLQFSTKKIEEVTKNVTRRNFFNSNYKANFMEKELRIAGYTSVSQEFLDKNFKIHGVDEVEIDEDKNLSIIDVGIDFSNPNLHNELKLKHSVLELHEIISVNFPEFYMAHIDDVGISIEELIYIIYFLGSGNVEEDELISFLNRPYRGGMFLSESHAHESLSKYSKTMLFLLINALDKRGFRIESFSLVEQIDLDEISSEELINLIIKKYYVFEQGEYLEKFKEMIHNHLESKINDESEEVEAKEDGEQIFDVGNDDDDESYESIDELLEESFFVDADSNDVLDSYIRQQVQLQEKLSLKIDDALLMKNPKAGFLMAIVDELALEELDLARQYIEFKYYELAKESSSDGKQATVEVEENH